MPVSVFEILTDSRHALVCLVDKGGAFAYVTASFVMFICIATDRLIAVNKPHSYKVSVLPRMHATCCIAKSRQHRSFQLTNRNRDFKKKQTYARIINIHLLFLRTFVFLPLIGL